MICIKAARGGSVVGCQPRGVGTVAPAWELTRHPRLAFHPGMLTQGLPGDGMTTDREITPRTAGRRAGVGIRRWLLGLAAMCLALAAPLAPARAQQPLGLGAMAPGTISHSTALAIAGVLTDRGGPEIRVLPNAGERVLLDLLEVGELDFAIANALEVYGAAQTGDAAAPKLVLAAVLYPLQVGLFVREDSGITSIADLAGRTVTTGFTASPGIGQLLGAVLATGGLSVDDVVAVPVSDLVSGADRFLDGRADAFFFALGAAKLAEVAASVPIRLVTLPEGAEAEARAQALAPVVYLAPVEPRPALTGVTAPSIVLAFDNLLVTRPDVPDAAVNALLDVLGAERAALIARLPIFAGLDPARLTQAPAGLPVHPAAADRAP